VRETRVVAMAAFMRSRGHGLRILVGASLALVLPLGAFILSGRHLTGVAETLAMAVSAGLGLWVASAVLAASGELTSPGE
jgi:hypothetical protein